MAYTITCDCGYAAHGETEDEIVAECEAHIEQDHPDLVGQMTREQILAMAEED